MKNTDLDTTDIQSRFVREPSVNPALFCRLQDSVLPMSPPVDMTHINQTDWLNDGFNVTGYMTWVFTDELPVKV